MSFFFQVESPTSLKSLFLGTIHPFKIKDVGKGSHLRIQRQKSVAFEVDFRADGSIRGGGDADADLKFEIENGKIVEDSRVLLFHNYRYPNHARKFQKNADGTISPRESSSLCLGADAEGNVILVKKSDVSRALIFSQAYIHREVKQMLETNQSNRRRLLLLSGNKNQAFPQALNAAVDRMYHVKKSEENRFGGRGCTVSARHEKNATIFSFDGTKDNFAVRVYADRDLSLAVDYNKKTLGNTLSFWCTSSRSSIRQRTRTHHIVPLLRRHNGTSGMVQSISFHVAVTEHTGARGAVRSCGGSTKK